MENRDAEYAVHADLGVRVPARDGTHLVTDVFRPADPGTREPISEPSPALLDRTPYGRRGRLQRHGEFFAARGYVVAIQDCRGRGDSGGEFRLFADDPEDGYDTVEWLAQRPYTDGQVGTIGSSYGAWVQTGLAALDPPGLEAMFVNQGISDGWESGLRHGGALELRWLSWVLTVGGALSQEVQTDPNLESLFASVDVGALFERGARPGETVLRHLPGYEESFFEIADAERATGIFESPAVNFRSHITNAADVPTVWSTGWYDSYAMPVCQNFKAVRAEKESDQYLLIGPWKHGWDRFPQPAWSVDYAGNVSFGEAAIRNYQGLRLAFFDHYLKREETWERDPVEFFLMGTDEPSDKRGKRYRGGEWHTGTEWPPAESAEQTYYTQANGTLAVSAPRAEDASTTYDFDPKDPVPTIGGSCSSYLTYEQRPESVTEYPLAERPLTDLTGRGAFHQASDENTFGASPPYGPLSERADVLTFRTPPLTEPVRLAGSVSVTLFASTDGPDTDFTAKLVDEAPPGSGHEEGFACNLTESVCRLRFRNHAQEEQPVEPGKVYELNIDLYPVANVFRADHRIRLDVSSSNFPRYDVNPNTGEGYTARRSRVARNTVYHDRERPTRVEFPVLPDDI